MDFDPGSFRPTYETELGRRLWAFLQEDENIIRMETASYLGRPAAEPLSPYLLACFGDEVRLDRMKQMLGRMIRQIMEPRGYNLDQTSVRITRAGNMFTSAARYKKPE